MAQLEATTIDTRTPEQVKAEFQRGVDVFLVNFQEHILTTFPETSIIGLPDATEVQWLIIPQFDTDNPNVLLGLEMRGKEHEVFLISKYHAEHRPNFDRKGNTTGETALSEANIKLQEILDRAETARAAQTASTELGPDDFDGRSTARAGMYGPRPVPDPEADGFS